jgi:hypothetical protein
MYKGKGKVWFEPVQPIDHIPDDTQRMALTRVKICVYSGVSLEENQKEIQPGILTLDQNTNPAFTEC